MYNDAMMRMPRLDPDWQLTERYSLLRPLPSSSKSTTSKRRQAAVTNKHIHTIVDHTRLHRLDSSSMTHLAAFSLFGCVELLQLHCVDFRFVVCQKLTRRDFVSETHFFKESNRMGTINHVQ
jgi:hypothetical protein